MAAGLAAAAAAFLRCRASTMALFAILFCEVGLANSQIAWTPIYVDGNSQVDLWTQSAEGCPCSVAREAEAPARDTCACCVGEGGCPCGDLAPHRCTQCGLENFCGRMCNVTLDARFLSSRSGKTFGQIKSPSLEGPAFCWYLLQPDLGQRVEVQVYRLVSAGRFNGSSCEGGFLQLVNGSDLIPSATEVQICGANERFSPPVVMFLDSGTAALLFVITEKSYRSQFLAYFSFTPSNSVKDVSVRIRGGHRVADTECDWMYQDYMCSTPGYCVLASPGYPGLYPTQRRCKYYITTSSVDTMVLVNLTTLLPYTHCQTHHVALYKGSTPDSTSLLKMICGIRNTEMTYSGQDLLVEFSSGFAVPPYDYNGFIATLQFIEMTTSSTEIATSTTTSPKTVGPVKKAKPKSHDSGLQATSGEKVVANVPRNPKPRTRCDQLIFGNASRSGHFDTKGKPWSLNCSYTFVGRATDIVHISLFNYHLRAASCLTIVEIYDGVPGRGDLRHRLCSPISRFARDQSGRFLGQETFVSSGNTLSLVMSRISPLAPPGDEYLNGAYLFHDEKIDGTLRPDTLCDVDYYGSSSLKAGQISSPGNHQIYWNKEGSFICSQRFIPAVNQSVLLTVHVLTGFFNENCHTICNDSGCQCVGKSAFLRKVDHLSFITDDGKDVACICGTFQKELIPLAIRSWSPLRILYYVANYSWMQGFQYTAEYSFLQDGMCGYSVISDLNGEIHSLKVNDTNQKSMYYYEECVWLFDSRTERQLTIELSTEQNVTCSSWNMTIYKYDDRTIDNFGEVLAVFCPDFQWKKLSFPWNLNIVILRLRSVSSILPAYTMRWYSQTEFKNPSITEIPQSTAPDCKGYSSFTIILFVLFIT